MNYQHTLIGFFLFCLSSLSDAKETSFINYLNARFNFQVSYPSFLVAQEEPANGSGRKFINNNESLTVYGSFFPNLDSQKSEDHFNIRDEFNFEKTDLQKQGYQIGYTFIKNNVFVISGTNGQQIAYIKKIFVPHCGVHLYLWLYYPQIDEKQWDPWVDIISKSFKYSSTSCQGDYITSEDSNKPVHKSVFSNSH
ncbi:hypothetical protein [Legionella quateirensis]|uniref:Uncharacterized protein n=1 Tax=Legionella quateirensis TaxID=45072 RepID=A0A378KYL2_9GAMM|nr:hypothetical protein [Legionella quateirensis]KTD54770.1 hypothetical protein Lqua_0277 [Legionella quateirensis]STY16950.1 Uncharacterised protein [Legionella quateirensis]